MAAGSVETLSSPVRTVPTSIDGLQRLANLAMRPAMQNGCTSIRWLWPLVMLARDREQFFDMAPVFVQVRSDHGPLKHPQSLFLHA